MTLTVLFAAGPVFWPRYQAALIRAFREADLAVTLLDRVEDPSQVDYMVYGSGGWVTDFGPYTRLKAVLSLWAGVERIAPNQTLTQPLCRMVDPGLTEGMVEYVAAHVLRHHLGMDALIKGQDGVWHNDTVPPLARERVVGFLGLGELGAACAAALAALRFQVCGWSRTQKDLPGIECHSGAAGLEAVLRKSAILVTLLPDTKGTDNLLNAGRLALLPPGAVIINPGRGNVIDDAALLAALDTGGLGHATLDVFRTEPLPPEHPFWAHCGVTVTPHIAAETRAESASRVIAENIRRGEAGAPFLHLVDRALGY